MEISPDIFGYAGMVTGVSFLMPQVYKSWKTRRVGDLSWGMIGIVALNCVFWFTYGLLLASIPLMLTNGTAFLVACAQMWFKYRYSFS